MKTFFNGYTLTYKPIIADIDNVVLKSETMWDGYIVEEKGVDIKQIKNIIKAIELLGYTVTKMMVHPCCYIDLYSKYYRKFPENIMYKIWKDFGTHGEGREVFIKGNRLYTKVDDCEIMLPKEMWSDYDNKTLRMEFRVN